jgi:L-fuculose-phosphate aldolase
MTRDQMALPQSVVDAMQRLDRLGLNRGTSGNVSVRGAAGGPPGAWVTPSGIGADALCAQDIVWVGADGSVQGAWLPSSEWPLHAAIYATRPDLHAVVHTHSVHASALACLRRELPAFHYMVAVAGGSNVPCTPYHLFGSAELSRAVAHAFEQRHACLMANHGLVAGGTALAHALQVAQEIESLCEVYLKALAAGEPKLLDASQMGEVIERFRRYGKAVPATTRSATNEGRGEPAP